MIINSRFNTAPVIIHNPGGNIFFKDIINSLFSVEIKKVVNNDKVSFITWNNKKEKGILEKSLDLFGINYSVLGKNVEHWKNLIKVDLTLDFLKECKTEYVVGVDSFDAVFVDNPNFVLEKYFENYREHDMVFNSSLFDFQQSKEFFDMWEKLNYKYRQRFVNAGVWIGKTKFCLEFFDSIKKSYGENPVSDSEQFYLRPKFKEYHPRCVTDDTCIMFQNLNCFEHPFKNYNPECTRRCTNKILKIVRINYKQKIKGKMFL